MDFFRSGLPGDCGRPPFDISSFAVSSPILERLDERDPLRETSGEIGDLTLEPSSENVRWLKKADVYKTYWLEVLNCGSSIEDGQFP